MRKWAEGATAGAPIVVLAFEEHDPTLLRLAVRLPRLPRAAVLRKVGWRPQWAALVFVADLQHEPII